MNWKIPQQNIFFLPEPFNPERKHFEITNWRRNPETAKEQHTVTNLKTGNAETFEILDYYGPYQITKIPDSIAFMATDSPKITGEILGKSLRAKQPEFKNCEKVIILILYKPATNDSKKE